jgi:hypothetical protein
MPEFWRTQKGVQAISKREAESAGRNQTGRETYVVDRDA